MSGSYLPQPFGQDVRLERERQNTALLDWERNVLLDLHRRKCDPLFAGVQESPFGLWFTHKAALLFRDKPIIGQVTDTMRHIDRELLPQLVTTHSTDPAGFGNPPIFS